MQVLNNGNAWRKIKKIDKEKKVIWLHLLIANGLGLAIIAFIAFWLQIPREILRKTELNTAGISGYGIALGILIGTFILQRSQRKGRISNITISLFEGFSMLATIAIIEIYYKIAGQIWEPWLINNAWFYRQAGIGIAIWLMTITTQSTISLGILIITVQKENHSNKKKLIGWLFLYFATFQSILAGLIQISGFISMAFTILIIYSIIFTIGWTPEFKDVILYIDIALDKKEKHKKVALKNEKNAIDNEKNEKIDSKIEHMKKLKNNWRWMSLFILLQIALWIYLILQGEFNANELLWPFFLIFIGSFLISAYSWSIRWKRDKIWPKPQNIKQGIKERIGTFFPMLIEVIKLIGIIYLIAGIAFIFPLNFLVPQFQQQYWMYTIIGILGFISTRKTRKIQIILYYLAIILNILLIFMIDRDVIANLYTYYSPYFDFIYPFKILGKPIHAILAGFSAGYLLTYEIERWSTHYVDKSNYIFRVILIMCVIIILSFLMRNLNLGTYGGQVGGTSYLIDRDGNYEISPFLQGKYLPIFWTAIGIIIVRIIQRIIWPIIMNFMQKKSKIIKKENNKKIKDNIGENELNNNIQNNIEKREKEDHIKNGEKNRKKILISNKKYVLTKNQKIAASIMLVFLGTLIIIPTVQPEINDAFKLPYLDEKNGISLFGAPSFKRIDPNLPIKGETSAPTGIYKLQLAKNEYEPFQIIISTRTRSLNGFYFEITDFTSENTNYTISKNNIEIRQVDNIFNGEFPDLLTPLPSTRSIHLIDKERYIFWITTFIPEDAPSEDYTGTIKMKFGNNEELNFSLQLQVWNFTIPNIRHIRSNFGGQTDSQPIIETYLKHRINTYGIPLYRAWTIEELNSSEKTTFYYNESALDWKFNWTWWDQQTINNLVNGMNAFYINCPLGMPREPRWVNDDDPNNISDWGIATGRFYAAVQKHFEELKENSSIDLFKYAYVYFIDEFQMFVPDGYTLEQYLDLLAVYLKIIKNNAPNLKIMTTSPPDSSLTQIRDYIDIYCPITSDYDKEAWNEAMSEGKEMWMYPCVGPQTPWPNSHLYNRLFEIRVLYWQAFHYNLSGFLYWSSRAYYHGNYGMGFNSWGDGWFIYEDEEGNIYDSIRWENWRDANEDFEYLWILNATINKLEEVNNPKGETYRSLLDDWMKNIAGNKYIYCSSGDELYQARYELGTLLNEISNNNDIDIEQISNFDIYGGLP